MKLLILSSLEAEKINTEYRAEYRCAFRQGLPRMLGENRKARRGRPSLINRIAMVLF